MSRPRAPRLDVRRREELRDELTARARAWLPEWHRMDGGDFGGALLDVAARLVSEVTERLDQVPEKAFRGFLGWLGVRGRAGRAGRLPVVFGMAAGSEPVHAEAPVQLQALDVDPPVTFETEESLTLVPAALASIVAADASRDEFFLPPAGFSTLEPPSAASAQWTVKAPADTGATQVQLEPELGLDGWPTLYHVRSQKQYRVTKAEAGIATIEPAVGADPFQADDVLTRVAVFAPFGESERNRQEHAVYIGSDSLLNLKTSASIGIDGGETISKAVDWWYWGGQAGNQVPAWRRLTRQPGGDRLVLAKPAGQIDVLEVDGKKSRWIRGTIPAGADVRAQELPQLKLTVNCAAKPQLHTCDATEAPSAVAMEAIANTTPVVLDAPFYPLGREPRLFDAFYLASPEAFSKKNASVEICFQLADGTTEGYTAARVGRAATDPVMLFGVAHDRNLHRLKQEDVDPRHPLRRLAPVRPPFSENGTAPISRPSAALNHPVPGRVSTLSRESGAQGDVLVGVTAGRDVWIWKQTAAPGASRWYHAGTIESGSGPGANRASAVVLMGGPRGQGPVMAALCDNALYHATLPSDWENRQAPRWSRVASDEAKEASDDTLQATASATHGGWKQIAPVFSLEARVNGADATNGCVVAGEQGLALYRDGRLTELSGIGAVVTTVTPLAIALGDGSFLVVVQQEADDGHGGCGSGATNVDRLRVSAWRVTPNEGDEHGSDTYTVEEEAFECGLQVKESFDWHATTQEDLAIVFCAQRFDDSRVIATWRPLGQGGEQVPSTQSEPLDVLHGAPGVLNGRVVVSGPHAEIVLVPFHPDPVRRLAFPLTALQDAWVIPGDQPPFAPGDVVAVDHEDQPIVRRVSEQAQASGTDYVFLQRDLTSGLRRAATLNVFTPQRDKTFRGKASKRRKTLELAAADDVAAVGSHILIEGDSELAVCRIESIAPKADGENVRVAALDRRPPAQRVSYTYLSERGSRSFKPRPALLFAAAGEADTAALLRSELRFAGVLPVQRVLRLHPPDNPSGVLLASPFVNQQAAADPLVVGLIESTYGTAQILAEPVAVHPELSWEYWDGTGWWTIKGLVDGTGNFTFSGAVTFCVPASLQPTDVAGRASHWIRARLVSGDYGRESVSISSVEDRSQAPPVTTQSVKRVLDEIAAPQVVAVNLYYSVCCASLPDFVLTRDGGAIRDQSAANRTGEAVLELFVPLAESLSRALYLGFDGEVTGSPLSILFLVESGRSEEAFPLEVDVLRGGRFERLAVTEDGTRGLNEPGVLKIVLAESPQRASLFGRSQHWLRIRPNRRMVSASWRPVIHAVYVNGTWATAAETQSNELLGSSDGSPGQRVILARPPVLDDSLRLRVKEPIGREEAERLRGNHPDAVMDVLNGRPGPWVLWSEVIDPADCGPESRVYALNDETGDITFGDGVHGKIPPPGRDTIAAERYRRGGGAAANAVGAWSQVNLISPVPGVERLVVPEGAAGGSDAQDAASVVRFAPANLFTRGRALTMRDLEILALQSSPDIAQVRAIGAGPSVRLVVAMRGADPTPPFAVRRELVRYLSGLASPMLLGADAETSMVRAPRCIPIRLTLDLLIAGIEQSGLVAREAATRIATLLDQAQGGFDRAGWRLGDRVTPEDLSAALDGIPGLESISRIEIDVQGVDGTWGPMPDRLRPGDLLRSSPAELRIAFETADTGAGR